MKKNDDRRSWTISLNWVHRQDMGTIEKWTGLHVREPWDYPIDAKTRRYHVPGLSLGNGGREKSPERQAELRDLCQSYTAARSRGTKRTIPSIFLDMREGKLSKRMQLALVLLYLWRSKEDDGRDYAMRGQYPQAMFRRRLCGGEDGKWRRPLDDLQKLGIIKFKVIDNPKRPGKKLIDWNFTEAFAALLSRGTGRTEAGPFVDPDESTTHKRSGENPQTVRPESTNGQAKSTNGQQDPRVKNDVPDQRDLAAPPKTAGPEGGGGRNGVAVSGDVVTELADAIHSTAKENSLRQVREDFNGGWTKAPSVPTERAVLGMLSRKITSDHLTCLDDDEVRSAVFAEIHSDSRYKVINIVEDVLTWIMETYVSIEMHRAYVRELKESTERHTAAHPDRACNVLTKEEKAEMLRAQMKQQEIWRSEARRRSGRSVLEEERPKGFSAMSVDEVLASLRERFGLED